jgi:biotin operon repressor
MQDACETVLNAIKNAGQPVKAGEVAKVTGLSDKEVAKQIKALQTEGKITSPKRCYYAPTGS